MHIFSVFDNLHFAHDKVNKENLKLNHGYCQQQVHSVTDCP